MDLCTSDQVRCIHIWVKLVSSSSQLESKINVLLDQINHLILQFTRSKQYLSISNENLASLLHSVALSLPQQNVLQIFTMQIKFTRKIN